MRSNIAMAIRAGSAPRSSIRISPGCSSPGRSTARPAMRRRRRKGWSPAPMPRRVACDLAPRDLRSRRKLYRRDDRRPDPPGRERALSHAHRARRASPSPARRQCRVAARPDGACARACSTSDQAERVSRAARSKSPSRAHGARRGRRRRIARPRRRSAPAAARMARRGEVEQRFRDAHADDAAMQEAIDEAVYAPYLERQAKELAARHRDRHDRRSRRDFDYARVPGPVERDDRAPVARPPGDDRRGVAHRRGDPGGAVGASLCLGARRGMSDVPRETARPARAVQGAGDRREPAPEPRLARVDRRLRRAPRRRRRPAGRARASREAGATSARARGFPGSSSPSSPARR